MINKKYFVGSLSLKIAYFYSKNNESRILPKVIMSTKNCNIAVHLGPVNGADKWTVIIEPRTKSHDRQIKNS